MRRSSALNGDRGLAHERAAESFIRTATARLLRGGAGKIGLALAGSALLLAVIGPFLAPYDPLEVSLREALQPPSGAHVFGTDALGRDLLSRMLAGARVAMYVGVLAVGIAGGIGVFLGLVAGFYGRFLDNIITAVIDVLLAFPGLLLALLVVSVLGPSLTNAILAVAIGRVPQFTRLTRGSVLSIRERDYVLAARAVGAGAPRVMVRHVLPNSFSPLIVYGSLSFGTAIVTAATLSFLGLGAQPPTPDWGGMLSEGRPYTRQAPWLSVIPGVAILMTVIGFNLLGDGLRDALDPRMTR